MSHVINNFKNISKSLSYHHQRQMCYRMADGDMYLMPKELHSTSVMQQAVATLEYKEELIEGGYYNQDSSVNRVKNVTIHGTKYAVGYVLVAYIEEEDLPVFGVIQDILLKQDICDTYLF